MDGIKRRVLDFRQLRTALWVVLGAGLALVLGASYWFESQPVPLSAITAWLLVWMLWIPLGGVLERSVRSHPVDTRNWRYRAPLYLLSGLLVASGLLTLRVLLDQALHLLLDPVDHPSTVSALLIQSFVIDILIFCGILALTHAVNYYDRYTVRSAELETRLSRVRLAFLRNQMQPHFLLNTLNMISALIYTDTEKADRMIADLGDLLRVTLEDSRQQEVPLQRELEYLEHYLDIARTRFGSSLQVERRIEPDTAEALVPSLVLQPLVENSLRYGLAERNGRSRITITARHIGSSLRLEVTDNGPGLPLATPGPTRMGIGLGNTRNRLEQLYGDRQRLEVCNRPEGGASATLELPYRLNGSTDQETNPEDIHDHPHSHRRRRAAGPPEDQVVSRA